MLFGLQNLLVGSNHLGFCLGNIVGVSFSYNASSWASNTSHCSPQLLLDMTTRSTATMTSPNRMHAIFSDTGWFTTLSSVLLALDLEQPVDVLPPCVIPCPSSSFIFPFNILSVFCCHLPVRLPACYGVIAFYPMVHIVNHPINIVCVFLDSNILGCNPPIKKLKQVLFSDFDHQMTSFNF